MAESAESGSEPRTFVKKVGDQTLTRRVTTPLSEVAARYDGYKPADETDDQEPAAAGGEREVTAGTAQPPPSPPTPPPAPRPGPATRPTPPGNSPS